MLRVDLTAWYWAPDGSLRECIVTQADTIVLVLDALTLEPVNVTPDNVLVEKP